MQNVLNLIMSSASLLGGLLCKSEKISKNINGVGTLHLSSRASYNMSIITFSLIFPTKQWTLPNGGGGKLVVKKNLKIILNYPY